jgi:hypothetical protein
MCDYIMNCITIYYIYMDKFYCKEKVQDDNIMIR